MIKLNPDKEYVTKIIHNLRQNDNHCPCRITKDETTKCMCLEFREQINGYCHCGLFYKE